MAVASSNLIGVQLYFDIQFCQNRTFNLQVVGLLGLSHQECVFMAGAVATSMYLTATGTYSHLDAERLTFLWGQYELRGRIQLQARETVRGLCPKHALI